MRLRLKLSLLVGISLMSAAAAPLVARADDSPSETRPAGSEGTNTSPSSDGGAQPEPTAAPPSAQNPPAQSEASPVSTPPTPYKDPNAGMYQEKFKCSDGYDPDKDPALHPPNQDSKVRMLINAQAQKEHEDRIQAEKAGGGPSETAATDSAKNNTDSRAENAQPKENQEKGKETAKEKQDSKNGDGKSSETAKKVPSSGPSGNAMTPVQEALFLIQAKKYQDSLSVLSPIIGKNSNNLDARYLMAISYVAMRKYPEAAQQYKKIIEIAPNSKQAALSVEGLRKIGQ